MTTGYPFVQTYWFKVLDLQKLENYHELPQSAQVTNKQEIQANKGGKGKINWKKRENNGETSLKVCFSACQGENDANIPLYVAVLNVAKLSTFCQNTRQTISQNETQYIHINVCSNGAITE